MESHVFYRDLNKKYPTAVSGKGVFITDKEGKDYLDGSSGALVVSVGHGNQEIINAMIEQMNRISFAHTSQFQTEVLVEYAGLLAEQAPGDLEYAYFVAGGSEGMDTAIKLARQYHVERGAATKYKVIGRWPSFHGHTFGALSVGGYTYWRNPHIPNLIPTVHIQGPVCRHCPYGLEPKSCAIQCAQELERTILREGPENISAFVFEPVIGSSASAVAAPDEYYRLVEEICKKYDVVLIADEVMCGFGRVGEIFASNLWGIKPDITVSGKGISSGYASLGLVMASSKMVETIRSGTGRFLHGFTSSGNPISMSAGLAVLKYMLAHDLPAKVRNQERIWAQKLGQLQERFEFIGDIRGKGLMWGIEFVQDRTSMRPYPPEMNLTAKVVATAFKNGLIVYPSQKFVDGRAGDSVMIAPPLIISAEEMDELNHRLFISLEQVENLLLSKNKT